MRRGRRGDVRERGGALVEFALVVPILLAIVFGVVDFGVNLSNEIGVQQGVREAARQASVANFGTVATCTTFTNGSTNMRKLACLTKARSDLTAATPAVAIRFDPNATSYPAGTGMPPVGNGILVCAITRFSSVTGAYSAFFTNKYLRAKAVMRIEKASGVAETELSEPDPSGQNWSWCTP